MIEASDSAMFKFDGTVNIPTLVMVAGWLVFLFKVWLSQRDINRNQQEINKDMLEILGARMPQRYGLLGDVEDLKDEVALHGDWLGAGGGRRQYDPHPRRPKIP